MATYAKYSRFVFDLSGNAIPGATITVTNEAGGLATLFSTRTGTGKSNPFTSDATTGKIEFYCAGGAYRIDVVKGTDYNETFRFEANGTFAEHDFDTLSEAFPVGSVGAPSIYFDGDATTGLYAPSVGTVGMAVGGAQVMKWAAALISMGVAAVITSNTAAAFAVGPNGATNPAFQIDGSTTSAATGLKITGAAAGNRVALAAISSGTNEGLDIDAKGSGTIRLGNVSTGNVSCVRIFSISDATDSSSLVSGSFQTAGGAAIGKKLYVGSTASIASGGTNPIIFGAMSNYGVISFNTSTALNGSLGIFGGAGGDPNILYLASPGSVVSYIAGQNITAVTGTGLSVVPTTASTSPTTGCATFAGGVGIAGALYVNSGIAIKPSSGNVSFGGYIPANTAIAQFVFYDQVPTYSGYLGYIGASAGLGTRNDTIEFGSNAKDITIRPNETEVIRFISGGAVNVKNAAFLSISATAGIGYGTGAGGTVTQLTSKSTGVTLSKVCGQITMNNAALLASTDVNFTLTNTAIAATDLLLINHVSGGTAGSYSINAQCAAGSALINVRNVSLGSLSEAIVIAFAVIKGVTA